MFEISGDIAVTAVIMIIIIIIFDFVMFILNNINVSWLLFSIVELFWS